MLKTYLYIPQNLAKRIMRTAQLQQKSKAEVMRQALGLGINEVQLYGIASAQALLKIAQIGQLHLLKGPKDSSKRIDELLWGKDWTKNE